MSSSGLKWADDDDNIFNCVCMIKFVRYFETFLLIQKITSYGIRTLITSMTYDVDRN
jgi:hypothetical protein